MVGPQETAAGGGTPQKSISTNQNGNAQMNKDTGLSGENRIGTRTSEGTGVASLAPATQNATSADVGKSRHALHDGVTKATKALGRALRAQDGGLESLLGKAAYLESLKDKLRSEQAKEAIKEVLTVIMEMKENREKVTRAFNVVVAQVQADSKRAATTAETVPISRSDAGTQSPCWWDTATPGAGLPAQPARTLVEVGEAASAPKSLWSEVVRKKGQKAKTPRTGGDNKAAGNPGKTPTSQPRIRTRPAAILVKVGAEGFPELAKKIRGGVNADVIGDSIVGVRQAKSGGLLIEIRGDQAQFDAVRAEVVRSAGAEVEVHSLQQRETMEVRDLDEWTGADEVAEAVANAVGVDLDAVKVLSLRKRFGGAQTALVSLPQASSRGLASSGRLRVGWVNCRVRRADPKVRCFRCLAFGHMSKDCVGPDRTECCRRCGEVGHKAASCNASATAINAFAKTVDEEGKRKP